MMSWHSEENIKGSVNLNDIELWHGDCLELMKDIPDETVDMILCDLPYGTTACKWDTVIPFDNMWKQLRRIVKSNAPIIFFWFTAVYIKNHYE